MKNDIITLLLAVCLISSGLAYTFYSRHKSYKSKIEGIINSKNNKFNFNISGVTEEGIGMEFFVICDIRAEKNDFLLDDIKNKFMVSLKNTSIYNIVKLEDNFESELEKGGLFLDELTITPTENTEKTISVYSKIINI
jgi:hypothetical protein